MPSKLWPEMTSRRFAKIYEQKHKFLEIDNVKKNSQNLCAFYNDLID